MIAFEGEMVTGLVIPMVPVTLMFRKELVEFLNWKKVPPKADVKAVVGKLILLNPEFVR